MIIISNGLCADSLLPTYGDALVAESFTTMAMCLSSLSREGIRVAQGRKWGLGYRPGFLGIGRAAQTSMSNQGLLSQ